jgi:hypothetical protein
MATKRPAKPRMDPLQEAADPATAPERLRQLTGILVDEAVRQVAWRNPSLPEDVWRTALLQGKPEAWANPMAPIYLLTWTPREDDPQNLDWGARWATKALWSDPERCSAEGKVLLATKNQEWWGTSDESLDMMYHLGLWAEANRKDLQKHREVVRILALCVQMDPHLMAEERQILDLFKDPNRSAEDLTDKIKTLTISDSFNHFMKFAKTPYQRAWYAWSAVDQAIKSFAHDGDESIAKHSQFLANLIRQEMPLPPEVE